MSEGYSLLAKLFWSYLLIWLPGVVLYRRYLHPLAHVPGPWLASITWLYEYYYDIWLGGQSSFKLNELHDIYGPVIRLNPEEVHIRDAEYYDEVFSIKNAPIEKPFKHANAFGPYAAMIGTINHDVHKIRRTALNPFFSRKSVLDLMPFLTPILENLSSRFEEAAKTGQRINLRHAYGAVMADILDEYCFSRRSDRVLTPDFDRQTVDNIDDVVEFGLTNIHLSWLLWPILYLPDALMRRASHAMADMVHDREVIYEQVQGICNRQDSSYEASGHRTIFHDLLDSKLPESEKKAIRLRDEAFTLVTAGLGSTSIFLQITTYNVTANPAIHRKLLAALKTVMPDRDTFPDLLDLEKLEYLTAIIQEGLRTTHAVSHRIITRLPKQNLVYTDHKNGQTVPIPAGTIIGMTSMLHHDDEEVFPDPKLFRPERWLECSEEQKRKMTRFMSPFSRGARGCLGYNLAMAEMYMVLAVTFRRFEFDISGIVRERDIDIKRDLLLRAASKESKGVVVGLRRVVN